MDSKDARKQRGSKAIKEMKACGFPPDKTKVVLKLLLKSFDNSWEMIEKDNYSVLVDALISHEEDQGFIKKTNEVVADDEDLQKKEEYVSDDTALCRKRSRPQVGNEPSSGVHSPGTSEQAFVKKSKSDMQNSMSDISQQALIKNSGAGGEVACPRDRYKGKEVVDTPMLPATQNVVCFKEPKLEPGVDAISNENIDVRPTEAEHCTFEGPIAIMPPPLPSFGLEGNMGIGRNDSAVVDCTMTSTDKNLQHNRPSDEFINESKENPPELANRNDTSVASPESGMKNVEIASSSKDEVKLNVTSVVSRESAMKHIEIASSSKGEVKLSLSFNCMSSGNSFLDMESILRKAEDECLKPYGIVQPNLSLMNLMKELCQTVRDFILQDLNC